MIQAICPIGEIASGARQPPGPVSIFIAGGCHVASGSSQHSLLIDRLHQFIDTLIRGDDDNLDLFNGLIATRSILKSIHIVN